MSERAILFSGEMVRAILDGRKTQTRRLVKGVNNANCLPLRRGVTTHVLDAPKHGLCPHGQPGDRLWCKEAWATDRWYDLLRPSEVPRATGLYYRESPVHGRGRFRSSIHMPRWASRLLLEVTEVRVERLQEISEGDAIAEGWPKQGNPGAHTGGNGGPFDWFRLLWNGINAKRGHPWESNPWVWRISFTRVEANDG